MLKKWQTAAETPLEKKIYQVLFQQELLGHQVHNASTLESTGNEAKCEIISMFFFFF